MEFGTESSPEKEIRETPALVKDKNGPLRLEMSRDHPSLVQHSRFYTQGWRANGDVSLICIRVCPIIQMMHQQLKYPFEQFALIV
jgi:hypothetical protein